MAREFISNIEEANKQLAAVDADLATAKASITETVKAKETAEATATSEKLRADTATTTATTAEALVKTHEATIAKLNTDLTTAKNAGVAAAAAAGVPAVAGVTPVPGTKPTDGKTGLARASAAFASMQPAKRS